MISSEALAHAWGVLTLFLIPVGGGIPAGVLLARDQGIAWPITVALYFVSDLVLASLFEPLLLLVLYAIGKTSDRMGRWTERVKKAAREMGARYATNPRPLALVMISFGVDPMTGRLATVVAGHGFFTGWLLAIAGDLLYFGVLMVSTLWLDGILGDGTWTTIIILVGMFVVPWIAKRAKNFRKK
jgi:hypothetical protein